MSLDAGHADRLVWLDTFGDLIGNTDRHFGNFCFFAEEARELTLTPTPVYDMLPMVFAPAGANLVERQFAPRPPTALNLHLWHEAANYAQRYWSRLYEEDGLSADFRRISRACRTRSPGSSTSVREVAGRYGATLDRSYRPLRQSLHSNRPDWTITEALFSQCC